MTKHIKQPKHKKTATRLTFFIKKTQKGASQNGVLYAVAALGIIGIFGAVMAGGITPTLDKLKTAPTPGPGYTCCDTGDGADCHPILEKQITYSGDTYALLKSNIVVNELEHYAPTNSYTPDGHKIYIGTSDHTANYSQIPGCEQGKDLIRVWPPGSNFQSRQGKTCYGIPNDELIYVCKDTQQACETQVAKSKSPFDVYYRIKDGPVPSPLSSWCPKPQNANDKVGQQIIGVPTPGDRKNLQLETFQIKQQETSEEWDNQWCKPAIYLYPTQKTAVNVKVNTIGKLNLTIPIYPQNGWDVIAYPDGNITSGDKTYPYLYYEASLPDNAISIPTNGYVVKYTDLSNFFDTTLPILGLNQSEAQEFTKYWKKELPNSPYYFIGVVPSNTLNSLAALDISPAPQTTIRVTLYFKPLDKQISVQPPQFPQITRNGFTVVEWGGIFKADKNHPNFSCLM